MKIFLTGAVAVMAYFGFLPWGHAASQHFEHSLSKARRLPSSDLLSLDDAPRGKNPKMEKDPYTTQEESLLVTSIPAHLMPHIMKFLNVKDSVNLGLSCKYFYQLMTDSRPTLLMARNQVPGALFTKQLQGLPLVQKHYYLDAETPALPPLLCRIEVFPNIKSLELINTPLPHNDVLTLCRILGTNTSLTALSLIYNGLTDKSGMAFARALKTNTSLQSLTLDHNHLTSKTEIVIAGTLRSNTSLKSLSLAWNQGIKDARTIAGALLENSTLTGLNLQGTQLTNITGIAFARALETNTSLRSLDLSRNDLYVNAGVALARALKSNKTLTTLNLQGNQLGKKTMDEMVNETVKELTKTLRTNTTLKYLDLIDNLLTPQEKQIFQRVAALKGITLKI